MKDRLDLPSYQEDLGQVLAMTRAGALLNGKTILVTGATGLIGTFFVDLLLEANRRGADIHVIAVSRNPERAMLRFGRHDDPLRFKILSHDVRVPFPDGIRFDVAIGGASLTHPVAYAKSPVETILTNVEGTRNLLEAAAGLGATVLFLSSVEIYGNARDGRRFREEDTGALDLSTARAGYTESKRLSEALCQAYVAERGLDVRIARLCRVFGPTVLEDDSKASSQFLFRAAAKQDIVLKSRGDQLFSFLHVSDAVAALLTILFKGAVGSAYNVASPECDVRLHEFASCAAAEAGTEVVFDIPPEIERQGYSIASTALLDPTRIQALGWTPRLAFADAVHRTIQALRELRGGAPTT